MSTIVSSSLGRRGIDHFEPESMLDPQEQRRLRGHLEKIDFATFEANQLVLKKFVGATDINRFKNLAHAAAEARAHWIVAAIKMSEGGHEPKPEQAAHLRSLRLAYEELTEAYDGLRRLVERGYLTLQHTT